MWLASVLALLAVASASQDDNSKQNPVVDHTIRVCVINQEEASNCQTLINAYSNHPRLSVACINKTSLDLCLNAFQNVELDVISLNPRVTANSMIKLLELANKQVIEMETKHIPLSIVKKSSPLQKFDDTRTSKLCISNADTFPSVFATALRVNALTEGYNCKTRGMGYEDIIFTGGIQMSEKPLKCLTSGLADVAMIDYETAKKQFEEEGLNPEDYESICKEGRHPVLKDTSCNLYSMNLAGSLQNQKERFAYAIVKELPRYLLKPYHELTCNYHGDFKVFSSNATSAEELVGGEFSYGGTTMKQLQEYRDSLPNPRRQ